MDQTKDAKEGSFLQLERDVGHHLANVHRMSGGSWDKVGDHVVAMIVATCHRTGRSVSKDDIRAELEHLKESLRQRYGSD
jgi:hypothetical protein